VLNATPRRTKEVLNDTFITIEDKEKNKTIAELSAAKRSLKTNLVLLSTFLVLTTIVIFVESSFRNYVSFVVFSVMKSAMPILVTVANFGTVKQVASQYWSNLKETIKF